MQQILASLFEPKSNASEITILLINLLDVKVSGTTLKRETEEHPNYPSLLSISDILNSYGVENVSIKLDCDKYERIPVPFITQFRGVNSSGNSFTIVKEINGGTTQFFDPQKSKWVSLSNEDFLKRCSGIILLVEVGENAGEKEYDKNVKQEKRKRINQSLTIFSIPTIIIIAGFFSLMHGGIHALLPVVFITLTLIGGITGVWLLWFELDQHNPLLQQICRAGKKTNCGAVLQSKAAKIGDISWSAIGFSYFMGILLLALFCGTANVMTLSLIAWINILALPYVLYSVYYQWRVAKQWCVMCLCVQGVLILQFTVAVIAGWHSLIPAGAITSELVIQIITAFGIPFLVTAILLPALQKAKEGKQLRTELQKLKHNPQIFAALLENQKEVSQNPEGLGIILGNPDAHYRLIKVCNPYCGPCAKAHQPIEDLLDNNPGVQVQILFTATNMEGDVKTPPVKHLLAIAEKKEEALIKQALDDWYFAEKKDYGDFAAKYPMNGELKYQEAKITAMVEWCSKMNIEFTPTFFIAIPTKDGVQAEKFYQLPEMYSVADLKYFFAV